MCTARAPAVIALLLCLTASAAFGADAPPWYVGGAIGRLHLDSDYASQVGDSRVAGDRGPLYDIRGDLKETQGGRVFGGWRLTPRFSFELDYSKLGEVQQDYTIPGQPTTIVLDDGRRVLAQEAFPRKGRSRIDGVGLSAVGAWPLGERFSLLGRVGAQRTRLRYDEAGLFRAELVGSSANPPPATVVPVALPPGRYADLKQTRPVLGLGIDYRLAERINLRGEWARYFGVGRNFQRDVASFTNAKGKFNVDLISLAATFSF